MTQQADRFLSVLTVMATLISGLYLACLPAGEAALVNIATAPGVTYEYLDQNKQPTPPALLHDTSGSGLTGNDESTAPRTPHWRDLEEKFICIRFQFPAPVAPARLEFNWLWQHDPHQGLDFALVGAVGQTRGFPLLNGGLFDIRQQRHSQKPLRMELASKEPEKTLLIYFHQSAQPEVYQFALNGLKILARPEELERIQRATAIKPVLQIERHAPCNLFAPDEPIAFRTTLRNCPPGTGTLSIRVTDFAGRVAHAEERPVVPAEKEPGSDIAFPPLPPGYYALRADLTMNLRDGATARAAATVNFGVCRMISRTAAEAGVAGCRLGIQLGGNSPEAGDAFMKLGLHWVRDLLQYAPLAGTREKPDFRLAREFIDEWVARRPTLPIFEMKTIPEWAYDAKRYGPREEKEEWWLTLPLQKPYQEFIEKQAALVPPGGHIFEIWNEPWDRFDEKDFAQLAQWTREAIKKVRPDALVGPNLLRGQYLKGVIAAGGMKGMDLLTLHPYSPDFKASPEEAGLRAYIRGVRQTLFAGGVQKFLPLYVTEIGWPTAPRGDAANTEAEQARYTVRAALLLIAEGVRAVLPYCMGQDEARDDDREEHFGFVRKDLQPKPVLIAFAHLGELLEGAEYAGDLHMEAGVYALAFRKGGQVMLAVWSPGGTRELFLRPFAEAVELREMTGSRRTVSVTHNRLSFTATPDPIYLLGCGKELLKDLAVPNQ